MKSALYRLVFLWVKDKSLAEDLLQNVFERSFLRQNELANHPNLNGWLVKSLKNEALMHFRKSAKLHALEDEAELIFQESEGEEIDQRVPKIFSLMKNLTTKQQEVFQLREVEGLSYDEIAEYLEISIEQVKVNLHRARKSIREQLTKQASIK
ncbi:RNA polymerase sigma factor [Algoriphagus algorifonticola]|uniref:RNA polymerase sigma factor n=1 Tax=Algoriphagus algorifonticola TaxID=2593007 RepID=UPI00202305BA|nr:RNA polymerase sigma factor [Algoriphagus algorifonticola]